MDCTTAEVRSIYHMEFGVFQDLGWVLFYLSVVIFAYSTAWRSKSSSPWAGWCTAEVRHIYRMEFKVFQSSGWVVLLERYWYTAEVRYTYRMEFEPFILWAGRCST